MPLVQRRSVRSSPSPDDARESPAPGRATLTSRLGTVGGGSSLPRALQAKMDRAFDADFSDVRVLVDGNAESVGAEAFATGSSLHFAEGRYQPDSESGQALIAHELSHVVQQRSGRVAGDGLVIDPSLEAEADDHGARAARGEHIGGGAGAPVQGKGIAQPFLPVAGAGLFAAGAAATEAVAWPGEVAASLFAWAGVEANATAVGTLSTIAGSAGSVGPLIAPGQSGVQAYSLEPWQLPGASDQLEMLIQAALINECARLWAAQQTPPPLIAAEPAPAPSSSDPSILDAIKAAALARTRAMIAQIIAKSAKQAESREIIWSDSGAATADSLGTVGAVMLHGVRGFRLQMAIELDPVAKSDPLIAASGLDGATVDLAGITGGDLIQGPSWRIGYGDSLSVNVQSTTALADGVAVNLAWQWDGNATYLTLQVTPGPDGTPQITEVSRTGTPDDNAWI